MLQPKTQAALFEVMEERQVSIDGMTYPMGEPYNSGYSNPVEQEGTYKLPEAQLCDRFLMKITMDYPALDGEINILKHHHTNATFVKLEDISSTIAKKSSYLRTS